MNWKLIILITYFFLIILTSQSFAGFNVEITYSESETRRIPAANGDFWILRTTFDLNKNNIGEKLINKFKEAIGKNSKDAEAYNNLAVAYGIDGNFNEAVNTFKKAIQNDNKLDIAHHNLAIAYKGQNRFKDAIEQCNKAIDINPKFVEAYWNLVNTYKMLDKYEKQIEVLKNIIKIDPNHPRAYANLCAVYYKQDNYTEAIQECTKSIKINPDYLLSHKILCFIYADQKLYDKAMKECKETIRIDKNNYIARKYIRQIICPYKVIEKFTESIEGCRQIIDIKPYSNLTVMPPYDFKPSDSLCDRDTYPEGIMYIEAAIKECKKAIKIDPNYIYPHINLCVIYTERGNYKEAIKECKKTIEINPQFARPYINLCQIYNKKKLCNKAIELCNKAIEKCNNGIKIESDNVANNVILFHYILGRCYLKLQNKESAINEYKILLKLNKNVADMLYDYIEK